MGWSTAGAVPVEDVDVGLLLTDGESPLVKGVGFEGVSVLGPVLELEDDSGDADFLSASAERLYDSDR